MALPIDTTKSPADNTCTLDYWEQRWTNNQIGWHQAEGNTLMWDYFNKSELTEMVKSRNKEAGSLKVFVPLCGKTRDMKILYDLGFTVVGAEFAAQPIREFFSENNIEATVDGLFTKSKDGRMIIGQGDLFSFTIEPSKPTSLPYDKYDLIWDRGSFEAINEEDRGKYASFMSMLLDKDGAYLINSSVYDRSEYSGPPLAASTDDLRKYFGENMSIELVASRDKIAPDHPERQKWIDRGISKMEENCHVMRLK